MKLRLLPLIISIVVSSVVLFGGWFVYRSVAVESPLIESVQSIQGVEAAKADIAKDKIKLELVLAPEADLRLIMEKFRETTDLNGRKIELSIDHQLTSEALERWWSQQLFAVAEAMEKGNYGRIPQVLAERQEELPGLQYDASIDEDYVYIRLVHNENVKFIVLPRVSRIGVWSK